MDFVFSQIKMKSWNIILNRSFVSVRILSWKSCRVNSWNLTVEVKRFAYALLKCVFVCVCSIKQFKRKVWFHVKLFELWLLLGVPDCNTNVFILTSLSFFTASVSFWTFSLVFLCGLQICFLFFRAFSEICLHYLCAWNQENLLCKYNSLVYLEKFKNNIVCSLVNYLSHIIIVSFLGLLCHTIAVTQPLSLFRLKVNLETSLKTHRYN